MRLRYTLLVFAAVTGAVGFGGVAGDAGDYFRILSGFFLVLFVCLLFGGRERAGKTSAG
jgi:uncharacterized membrane protein YtjA (UPF0391 family)